MSRRMGTKTIPKPIPLTEKQRTKYGLKWILDECKSKHGRTLEERLARELIAIITGESKVLGKRDDLHRFATVNRGNASVRV